MVDKIFVDAIFAQEIRVAVLDNKGKVCNFDYESNSKKLLKGNIYLAKVTRVEPSLQAAFVEYEDGKHGFLPFAEIHPDYYQIPAADKLIKGPKKIYSRWVGKSKLRLCAVSTNSGCVYFGQ